MRTSRCTVGNVSVYRCQSGAVNSSISTSRFVDVVTKVNGTPVMSPREITGIVRSSSKKAISLTVVRNKKEIGLNVEIAANNNSGSGSSERVAL